MRGDSEPLDVRQILEWADAHFARTGQYPDVTCGRVIDAPWEKWVNIDGNLRRGERGLPSGWSLAQLLDEFRFKRNLKNLPRHTMRQILEWADAHFARTGQWPSYQSGAIEDASGETWHALDMALRAGFRGLRGGSSLRSLLRKKRGVRSRHPDVGRMADQIGSSARGHGGKPKGRGYSKKMRRRIRRLRNGRNIQRLPPFTVAQLLSWADAFFARRGRWPLPTDGLIKGTRGETWCAVEMALSHGLRGLPGDSSLARLFAEHRAVRNPLAQPPLSVEQILRWADEHHRRTGHWPAVLSGPIEVAPDETWVGINSALRAGRRGLAGNSSLAQLLDEHRGTYRAQDSTPLSLAKLLQWADAWHERQGKWPSIGSGAVPESPGDNWKAIDTALYRGHRGLPGGNTLAQILAQRRGKRNTSSLPPLTEEQILAWADAYHAQHGQWPTQKSGPVQEAPGETWGALYQSLRKGRRGLPSGSSLSCLLAARRGKRNPSALPPLTENQVLTWADAFHARHGRWPNRNSGPVEDAPGEKWEMVDWFLVHGRRGLPRGSSLAKLLDRCRRKVPAAVGCAAAGAMLPADAVSAPNGDDAQDTTTLVRPASANVRAVRVRPK